MIPTSSIPIVHPWKKHLRIWAAVCLAAAALWAGYVLWRIDQTSRSAAPQKADVAIVLGAAVWGDQPSPGLRERLDLALQLYREGYVPTLIVSGGLGDGKGVTEAQVMRNYLVEQGVPADRILMESEATNTYENLLFSRQIMQQNGLHSALVVSHDYHLARAMDMTRALGISAHPVGTKSNVMYRPYHLVREVLAYTKWRLTYLGSQLSMR
ncbi:MAG: YdcF family protein [Brevibacillus sp.]|jgi:uncharacterized SAM-binding protein YcdF (DUF218 family)|uniref:DUF218 domain-containing protein n=1 Tax=Brevibacillus aydinogluensis TaxID=927786 RepID=A0AA48MCB5_9BACL|nr:YdcF family protein [Brevibacillus aydinogluensis]REK68262.1 MAG: YdcF family protein [Brevibacillus sp.]CAJ1003625.1 DUF218 domain-containing protein [Brevibacillus aydinogluensis]